MLAINALYKLPKGEMLLQDAPELIERVLQVRSDAITGHIRRECRSVNLLRFTVQRRMS